MGFIKYSSTIRGSIKKTSSRVEDLFTTEEYKSYASQGQDLERILKTAILASSPSELNINTDENFYFRNRAISAGGIYKVEFVGPRKANLVEEKRMYGYNDNLDYFPATELNTDQEGYGYKTFVYPTQAHICVNHDFKEDGSRSIGKVIAAFYNNRPYPEGQYVELISYINKGRANQLYPGLLDAIEADLLTDTSMGVWCERAICSFCGNVATTEEELCQHVLNKIASRERGGLIYEVNMGLKFFEDSLIGDPSLWDGSYRVYQIPFSVQTASGERVMTENAGADRNAKILQVIAKKDADRVIKEGGNSIQKALTQGLVYNPDLLREVEEIELIDGKTGDKTVLKVKGIKRCGASDVMTMLDLDRITSGDYVELNDEPAEYRKEIENLYKKRKNEFRQRKEKAIMNKTRPIVFVSDGRDKEEEKKSKNKIVFTKSGPGKEEQMTKGGSRFFGKSRNRKKR